MRLKSYGKVSYYTAKLQETRDEILYNFWPAPQASQRQCAAMTNLFWEAELHFYKRKESQTFFSLTQVSLFEWKMLNNDALSREALHWDVLPQGLATLAHFNSWTNAQEHQLPLARCCDDKHSELLGRKPFSFGEENREDRKIPEWFTVIIPLC